MPLATTAKTAKGFDYRAPSAEHTSLGGSVMVVEVWMWLVGIALVLCFLGWIKDSFF